MSARAAKTKSPPESFELLRVANRRQSITHTPGKPASRDDKDTGVVLEMVCAEDSGPVHQGRWVSFLWECPLRCWN